jgi:hypothetical protein
MKGLAGSRTYTSTRDRQYRRALPICTNATITASALESTSKQQSVEMISVEPAPNTGGDEHAAVQTAVCRWTTFREPSSETPASQCAWHPLP